jgi:hypothetical protein
MVSLVQTRLVSFHLLTCFEGYINSGKNKYSDASGFNLDNQVLVFKVRLPKGSDPL